MAKKTEEEIVKLHVILASKFNYSESYFVLRHLIVAQRETEL